MRRARFQPGLVPTLASAAAVAVLLGLGSWQLQRLEWKQALLAEWTRRAEAPPLSLEAALAREQPEAWRRVRARGRFDPAHSIFVMRVRHEAREGARVLTPLRLAEPRGDAEAVLVDRGWLPYSAVERFVAEPAAAGPVSVVGLGFPLALGDARPGAAEARREWAHFDPSRHGSVLQPQLPYRLAPLLIQLEPADDAELADEAAPPGDAELPIAGYETPRSRVDHRGYAITWFSMAAIAVAVWVGWGLSRGREAG